MALITFHSFDAPGEMKDAPKIDVDDTGGTAHTLSESRGGITFQNVGSSLCWFGGITVDPTNKRGNILFPVAILMFTNVQKTFNVYFKCEAGETTTVGVVETL